jgi:hypothetical protein
MACKYPALISAVLPFGMLSIVAAFVKLKSTRPAGGNGRAESNTATGWRPPRSWSIPVAFTAGWLVIIGPWLARNVIDTGNPVYPLGYSVFGGRHWDSSLDAKWRKVHGPRDASWPALVDGLLDVAGRSDWQSPLYTALVPLAFLQRRTRKFALVLFGYVVYLFATWWLLTHRLDRFWLPLLPALAMLAGLGADWTRARAWAGLLAVIMAIAILTNLVFVTTALTGLNQWTDNLDRLRREVPQMINPALAQLDAQLPRESKVLLVGQAGAFHVRHSVVYNSVFNRETIETLARDRTPAEARKAIAERGITHIYVDWAEVERYRRPGNYGFTDFVTRAVFERLVHAGILEPLRPPDNQRSLYKVIHESPAVFPATSR